jgi:tripartite motif-containing protein 71
MQPYNHGAEMKPIGLFLLLTGILIASGCAPTAPASTPTPKLVAINTPLPTSTPKPSGSLALEVAFQFNNTPDRLTDPYGIALDSAGNIYINDAGNSRVVIFDGEGNFLSKWDKHGSGEGEFKSLGFGGIAIDANDNVFVVDNGNHRIQKFDQAGNFLLQWGSEGREDSQFIRAIGIAVDKDGNVYVTDDGNPFVQKFDNHGKFVMKFGGGGVDDGQFRHATGIAVDTQGNIFVADYQNKRVQKFNSAGEFIMLWRMGTDIKVSGVPEAIAVDSQGQIYITDYDFGRMQVFTNAGEFLWALSGKKIMDNPLKRPVGLAFDTKGHILIVNQSGNSVQVFNLP